MSSSLVTVRAYHDGIMFGVSIPQVWYSLTLITEIKHQSVSLQMISLTGSFKKCIETVSSHEKTLLANTNLSKQQQLLVESASERLKTVDI